MTRFTELDGAMRSVDAYYEQRGIFQDRFGFGKQPAVVVDFAFGWTDDAYAGGSRRLDAPVENTARLLEFVRNRNRPVPIIICDCVGDRAEAAHEWTLFDIQARFADVEPLDRVLDYLQSL